WRGLKILETLIADPDVAVIICPITGALASMSKPLARDLAAAAETTDKPICAIWGSPVGTGEEAYEILRQSSKVVTFRTFNNCVSAVRAWFDYHDFRARYRSPFAKPVMRASAAAKQIAPRLSDAGAGATLSEH